MQLKMLERAICPQCKKAPLELAVITQKDQDIIEGSLKCRGCQNTYPIYNGIPDFRPADLLSDSGARTDKGTEIKRANILFHNDMAKYYETDASTIDLFEPYTQARMAEILDNTAPKGGTGFLLDLGCGTGNVLMAGKQYFKESLGVDLSPGMLAVSRERNFEVICADIENVPLNGGSADIVTCFSVLHHLYQQEKFFREVYRLLKQGGTFYSDYDPNKTSAIIAKSWLYSLGVKVFMKLFSRRKDNIKELGLNKLQELVEYYHKTETGLDTFALKALLEKIGFKKVTVVMHSNCASLKKNSFWHIPLINKVEMVVKFLSSWKPDYSKLATYFLILAEK
jgi:ubiquinone/menaquinone biosynthesis C-methylase UbiE/uncharacterized protein YbaR (Trm112 family)